MNSALARRRSSARLRRAATVCLATAALGATGIAGPAPATAATEYPVGNLGTALANFLASPGAVAGANDWDCEPSAEHPEPVVLVHATGVNLGANYAVLSPMLANAGYCVYGFNYGMAWFSAGRVGGMGDIAAGARTMDAFVDRVLAATKARKVDVVGHSQGGMMPNYYIKRLGGAAKVRTMVALAPSNHGTTLNGLVNLGQALNVLGFANTVLTHLGAPGLVQQEQGSDFQKRLWADGDTVSGPRYVTLTTRNDRVVTPYTNGHLNGPAATNIVAQDQCPGNWVGHVGMFNDGPTMQNVLNALGPNVPGFKPKCEGYGLPN
ncbi:esterase/lipase family protein [Spirillospora sp. CA-294931]|uniref:esterase/lipase family protein n=1 Tax=Spirillospora sp. CA-294931 TaxID=3240042 RepID=UPI003D90FC1F